LSTNDDSNSDLPIRRYKARGNRRNIGIALGAGIGAAVGAATGQMGVWVAVGAGVGLLLGSFLQLRRNRPR